MALNLMINGRPESFAELSPGDTLADIVMSLKLKSDRVAIEHNGEIASRERWNMIALGTGDRLEIVHFVGGGAPRSVSAASSQDHTGE